MGLISYLKLKKLEREVRTYVMTPRSKDRNKVVNGRILGKAVSFHFDTDDLASQENTTQDQEVNSAGIYED